MARRINHLLPVWCVAWLSLSLSGVIFSVHAAPANMVWIPSGAYTRGDGIGDGYFDERPLHTAYVSGFYMDKYEVTKKLWDEVYQWARAQGYTFDNPGLGKAENHPVHTISRDDVLKWCNARSQKENLTAAYYTGPAQTTVYRTGVLNVNNLWVKWNSGYRLPTEAEWERAARGGLSRRRFPWGDTISHSVANYRSLNFTYDNSATRGYHPQYNNGIIPYTSPVGSFTPNRYGLHDMTGNVAEWCWDWLSIYSNTAQTNSRGPSSGTFRVLRGGSWSYDPDFSRVSVRTSAYSYSTYADVGFRTVLPQAIEALLRDSGPGSVPAPVNPSTQYPETPLPTIEHDSLVLVTHGWQLLGANADITWIKTMADSIRTRVFSNWRVEFFDWRTLAVGPSPDAAVTMAKNIGGKIGKAMGSRWRHVHFIGHSAGAALIQAAASTISSDTIVHTTFLDPYFGTDFSGLLEYGRNATWSDSYFSRDWTRIFTEGILPRAFNVDVTALDPNATDVELSGCGLTDCGTVTVSPGLVAGHAWPYRYYQATITNSIFSPGLGFARSKEGGDWNSRLDYPPGTLTNFG